MDWMGGSSGLAWLCLVASSCTFGQRCVGWRLVDSRWPHHIVDMWPATGWANVSAWATWFLILQKASRGLFTWWLDRFPKEVEIYIASWNLGSELALFHFYHILLAKAIHPVSPDSRGREIDSTSWWEEIWSHIAKSVDTRRGITVARFAIDLPQKVWGQLVEHELVREGHPG